MTEFRKFCIAAVAGSMFAALACWSKGLNAYNTIYWQYHIGMMLFTGFLCVAFFGNKRHDKETP